MSNDSRKNPRRGNNWRPKKEFKEELLAIDRVTRVTSWGRQLRFRAVMVLWDGKWRVWLWTWKSWEVVDAIAKAVSDAKKNMINVKIENWTVPYNVESKYKAARMMIHPASEWTWIIAWGSARKVLIVAWYKDVLAKRYGSTNLINNAKATLKALTSFKETKKIEVKKIEEK
jgi:small subunit ribosomal protein S5